MKSFIKWAACCLLLLGVASAPAVAEDPANWFSGQTEPYTDSYNGYSISIPVELKLGNKGASTDWTGRPVEGQPYCNVHVNYTPMHGVQPIVMYQANIKSYKQNRDYTDVVALPATKFRGKPVYAFRVSEALHRPGAPDPLGAEDIHRWHMFVFGNDGQYIVQCDSLYSAFADKKVQATFNQVFKSFGLVKIK